MSPPSVDELRTAVIEMTALFELALAQYRAGRIENMVRCLRSGAGELNQSSMLTDATSHLIWSLHSK